MKRIALIGVLLLFKAVIGNAQVYKFGDVPKEQLEMEIYEKDSTASAVVLFSTGEAELSYLNEKFFLTVKRHIRIKILTDEGLAEGDIEIPFRNKKSTYPQGVSRIKAVSYFIQPNGKVLKESVGRKDRFEEKISETRSSIKFSVPALKKGSVFEYSYEISSNDPLDFPSWVFQDEIPVLWSEYKAKIPEWFRFLTVKRGYEEFVINEQKSYSDRFSYFQKGEVIREGLFEKVIPEGTVNVDFFGTEFHYAMQDLPGLTTEPYMKASMDYLSHIRFQLSSIQFPGQTATSYLDSWYSLVNTLSKDSDYGGRLKSSNILRKATEDALVGAETDLDKMISIYKAVANHMEWNDEYGLYAFDNLDDVYEKGIGNGTSINLILVQMLREAGLEAFPIALSTRFNGEIVDIFPLAGQFNHTAVYVQFGDEYYLLDAKNDKRPYNLLPSQVLNGQGLIIVEDNVIWVPLENKVRNVNFTMVNINFTGDGFTGSVKSENQGFYAVDLRNSLKPSDLKASVKEELFSLQPNLNIDSVTITKDKLDESFDFTTEFSFEEDSQKEIIYFNPIILNRITDNPFKLENRTFPIDFDYTFSETMIINITIPEGWVIDELPTSVLHRLSEQSGEFRRILQQTGNQITMNYRFKIDKTRFMPAEYIEVKEMYGKIVEMLGQNIVLKKDL